MTVSIQFTDGYILDLTDVSTAKVNPKTHFLELTRYDGKTHRKQCFNLNNITTYAILTETVNEIVK